MRHARAILITAALSVLPVDAYSQRLLRQHKSGQDWHHDDTAIIARPAEVINPAPMFVCVRAI
jgi:hypothetical protein